MSATLAEPTQHTTLQAEITGVQHRLAELEREVARLTAELPALRTRGEWRAALERLQQGWASMDPEFQEECLASLKEAERRSRAPRVAD